MSGPASRREAAGPPPATGRSALRVAPPGQLEQPDQRLGVAALRDRVLEVVQRPRDELDALVLTRVGLGVRQPGGELDMDLLVAHPDTRPERLQLLPVRGGL